MTPSNGPLRVGIGGPVGSGKTALMEQLCKRFRDRYEICAITNDIYTKEDARILTVAGALPEERILGVETGGCPHTAIREDASINLAAVAEMSRRFPKLDLVLIESGGDNLAATFSPELADITLYVIDVAGGEKIPRKGGPGITRSDLLIVNKTDLAPLVGRRPVGHGGGHAADARRATLRVRFPARGRRRGRGGALRGGGGRPRPVIRRPRVSARPRPSATAMPGSTARPSAVEAAHPRAEIVHRGLARLDRRARLGLGRHPDGPGLGLRRGAARSSAATARVVRVRRMTEIPRASAASVGRITARSMGARSVAVCAERTARRLAGRCHFGRATD